MYIYSLDEIPNPKVNKYLYENITNIYELDDLCKSVKGYEKKLLAIFKDYPYRLFASYNEKDKILHFMLVTHEGNIYANYPVKKDKFQLVFSHKEWILSNIYKKIGELSVVKEREKFKELLSNGISLQIFINTEVSIVFGYNKFEGLFCIRDIDSEDIVDFITPDEFFDTMELYSKQ